MGIVYALISFLFLIFLVLRIMQMLGGSGRRSSQQRSGPVPKFDPNRYNEAPLPKRSAEELKQQQASMRNEWVTYNGSSPPLKLHMRGQSYESYRRVIRKHIDRVGQRDFEAFSLEQKLSYNMLIMADAYVAAWEGAIYPNGNAMPYSPENLAILMSKDEFLVHFIHAEAERISPTGPRN